MPSSRHPDAGRRPPPPRDRAPSRRRNYYRAPSPEEAQPSGEIVEGTVKRFDPEKGYGFVELSDGAGNAFLHATVLEVRRLRFPQPGARLRGRVGEGPKGLQITEVLELSEGPAPTEPARRGARQPARGGARSPGVPMLGTVRWFDPEKGFGFVGVDDEGGDVFLHSSVLQRTCMANPAEGQRVMVLVSEGARGREALSIAPAD